MWCLNHLSALGRSVIILKQTQQSCAALFTSCEQGFQEILQLKYMAMKEANRTEQNITAQKYIDQLNISSLKGSIMRNYVACFPAAYLHIMEFSSWDELEDYVNETVRKNKEQKK